MFENKSLFNFVASISGGKDSQAMLKQMQLDEMVPHSIIHCDLGKMEWSESLPHCYRIAQEYFGMECIVLKRKDGLGLLEYIQRRMNKLSGTGKPFWPSSKARFCTSDTKRAPSDAYYRTLPTDKIIVSMEGIRADESAARSKKQPLTVRKGVTSSYYKDMTSEQAIANFKPGKRLVLTYYPIFNKTTEDVYELCGQSIDKLIEARKEYRMSGAVPSWWTMHPAYAYGNNRVSCRFCILGDLNDLRVAKQESKDDLLDILIGMEEQGNCTFKNKFSLKEL